MKTENILTLGLAGLAIYYIVKSRRQQTYTENVQARAQRMTERGGRRPNMWGDASGHVFDWIDYRMSEAAGGGGGSQTKQMI